MLFTCHWALPRARWIQIQFSPNLHCSSVSQVASCLRVFVKKLHFFFLVCPAPHLFHPSHLTLRNLDKSKELCAISLCSVFHMWYVLLGPGNIAGAQILNTCMECLAVGTVVRETCFQIHTNHHQRVFITGAHKWSPPPPPVEKF